MKTIVKNNTTVGGKVGIKQRVRFGKPCVKGTRIAVADILNLIISGYGIKEIPHQYPQIVWKDVLLAIQYAARSLGKEEILEIQRIK